MLKCAVTHDSKYQKDVGLLQYTAMRQILTKVQIRLAKAVPNDPT